MIRAAVALTLLVAALAPRAAVALDNRAAVRELAQEAAGEYGVSQAYIEAIIGCETGYTYSPWLVGAAGETGLAQWHPAGLWWETPAARQGYPRPYGWATAQADVDMLAWALASGLARHWSCA